MKTIDKNLLDEIIRITQKYRKTGDGDILQARITMAQDLSTKTFGNISRWTNFTDLARAIVGIAGLDTNATNETIYEIFKLIGYEVTE